MSQYPKTMYKSQILDDGTIVIHEHLVLEKSIAFGASQPTLVYKDGQKIARCSCDYLHESKQQVIQELFLELINAKQSIEKEIKYNQSCLEKTKVILANARKLVKEYDT